MDTEAAATGTDLRIELERLRAELDALKRDQASSSRWSTWLPVVSTLVPVLGLVFAVVQFSRSQAASQQQLARQSVADSIQREREFMQPVLERQMTAYFEATTAAATIASARSVAERDKAIDTFWKLYWGPLVMLESPAVSGAMVEMSKCLNTTTVTCDASELKNRSLALASAMQTDYFSAWKLSPAQYAQRSINYAKPRPKNP